MLYLGQGVYCPGPERIVMNFSIKSLAAAAAVCLLGTAAQAASLDSLQGPHNWKLQGTTSEYSPAGVARGNETTWGIGQITQINDNNGDAAWIAGASDGSYLYYVLYGIADLQITATPGGFEIYNVGCTGGPCDGKIHLDIYRMNAPIAGILKQDPDSRTGFGTFNGLSNAPGASLYLALELAQGKVIADDPGTAADETTATLKQTTDATTLPTSGTGTFYANAVGGTGKAQWDSNGFPLAGGLFADFDANFTLKPNNTANGGPCTNAQIAANDCFAGLVNDPVQSNAIPEPGTIAMAGLALAGLGLSRRRRAAKA